MQKPPSVFRAGDHDSHSWDAEDVGGKVLFMEQGNEKLISIEIKDSIGSRHLGVQEFHPWEAVHLNCLCIHWGQICQEIKFLITIFLFKSQTQT